jgi:hypothetical protein
LRDALTKLGRLPTATEAAAALTAAIEDYSKSDMTVGGPINILKLTNAGPPQWSGTPPGDGGLTQICDLVRERNLDIRPTGTEEEMDRHLKASCR